MSERPARFEMFNTEGHLLHSSQVGQTYRIGVWLPFAYGDGGQTYPTLYLPDAEYVFAAAVGLLPMLMARGAIPHMLMVGVAYEGIGSYGEFGALRERDLLPEGMQSMPDASRHEATLRFWRDELIPFVESHYRADSAERALFGFSAGATFCLEMALAMPGLFRRHVACSGTWPGVSDHLVARAEAYTQYALAPSSPAPETSASLCDLYLAAGALEDEMVPGMERLAAALAPERCPGLRLTRRLVPGEGHTALASAVSLLEGLEAVYAPRGTVG